MVSEQDNISTTLYVTNSLSLLGSFSIVALYMCYSSLRSFAFKLVFFMSISDIIRAIGFLIPNDSFGGCIAQSFLTSFGSLSGVLWTSIIAFSLYSLVILEMTELHKYMFAMITVGYILPLFVSLLPFTTNSYGEAEGWCWLKPDSYQLVWRIGSFYAIVVLVVLFNVWSYYRIIREIRYEISLLEQSVHEVSEKEKLFKRFSLYPLVIVACYFPVLCKRIYELIHSEEDLFWLTILSATTTSVVGLLNAAVYGLTNNVKETIMNSCARRDYSSSEGSRSINNEDIEDGINISSE